MKLKILGLTLTLISYTVLVSAHEGHNHEERAEIEVKEILIPTEIQSLFPDASSIILKEKLLSNRQMLSILQDTGIKPDSKKFYTYFAYRDNNGQNSQLGTATIIDIKTEKPMQFILIYNGKLLIKKIIPIKADEEFKSEIFLDQFINKDHHQGFMYGKDIKFDGSNKSDAEAVIQAIKINILSMQAIYGRPHHH